MTAGGGRGDKRKFSGDKTIINVQIGRKQPLNKAVTKGTKKGKKR